MSGAATERARIRKERRYLELVGDHGRARLVVLTGEIGGRLSSETAQFLNAHALASAKVRDSPLMTNLLRGRGKEEDDKRKCVNPVFGGGVQFGVWLCRCVGDVVECACE